MLKKTPAKNGHSPKARPLDIQPDDGMEEVSEPWSLLYGGKKIRLPMISELPSHSVIAFAIMRMQGRLCDLQGTDDDPDLAELFEQDFEELMIGRDREGRREGVRMAQAMRAAEVEDEGTDLFGQLNR
jgi:hypothetical protein